MDRKEIDEELRRRAEPTQLLRAIQAETGFRDLSPRLFARLEVWSDQNRVRNAS